MGFAMSQSTVLGVGNILHSDEGVGIRAVNYLQDHYSNDSNMCFLDGGTLGFILFDYLHNDTNLIIIDAMQLKAPAGSIRCLVGDEIELYFNHSSVSVHEIGIIDLLAMARLSGTLPKQRALIGIQPQTLAWGEQLSAEVKAVLPNVAKITDALLSDWGLLRTFDNEDVGIDCGALNNAFSPQNNQRTNP